MALVGCHNVAIYKADNDLKVYLARRTVVLAEHADSYIATE